MPRPTLFDHPKFLRLVRVLDMPAPHVLGHLEFLWKVGYASGEAVIGDADTVEACAHWAGATGVLARALEEVKMIDRCADGRFQIHDLHEHAPDYVSRRSDRETERRRTKKCEFCERDYRSPEVHSKYCSETCRKKAWRKSDAGVTHGTHGRRSSVAKGRRVTFGDEPPTPTPTPTPITKEEYPLPPSLDNEAFKEAWKTWIKHRSEIKAPVKPTMAAAMLKKLSGWGLERAIAAIEHTVAMGWQGLKEPDAGPQKAQAQRNGNGRLSIEEFARRASEPLPGGLNGTH